jgi:hypothetical protein
MNPPSFRVKCSCGREATIHWNGLSYETTTHGWTCSWPAGWTCGRTGHLQRTPPELLDNRPNLTPTDITI